MENRPWQRRAKEAGLPQRRLAWIADLTPQAVSKGLRGHWRAGVPRYLKAIILAWRIMSPEMRRQWLAELEADAAAVGEEPPEDRTP